MGQVATVRTTLTQGQALGALLFGGCPQSALLMVGAQSAVETTHWTAMANNNFGNITPSTAQVIAGISWMTQSGSGTQGLKYIAYPNAVAGASAMVSWLGRRGLLSYAIANDLDGYMSRLQATCYLGCVGLTSPAGVTTSTTDYSNYRAGISTWMSKLAKVTPTIPPGVGLSWIDIGLVGVGAVAGAVGLVAVTSPHLFNRYI